MLGPSSIRGAGGDHDRAAVRQRVNRVEGGVDQRAHDLRGAGEDRRRAADLFHEVDTARPSRRGDVRLREHLVRERVDAIPL